jgi:hypothetical protein
MLGTGIVAWGLVRFEAAVLIYFFLVNSFYALLLLCAYWEMRQHLLRTRGESRWRLLGSGATPKISMIAPAYNEAATIGESLRGLLTLYYPNLEVVVINDGSKDGTMDVPSSSNLFPRTPFTTAESKPNRFVACFGLAATPAWWWWTRKTEAMRTPSMPG